MSIEHFITKNKSQIVVLLYQKELLPNANEQIENLKLNFKVRELKTITDYCNFFNNNNYINALCLSDYKIEDVDYLTIPAKIVNKKKSGELEFFYLNSDYDIQFYYTDQYIYDKIENEINIINPNGKFHLVNNEDLSELSSSFILKKDLFKEILYPKKHVTNLDGSTKVGGYDSLNRLINFFIKNGKILFCGMKENFKEGETLYRGIVDNVELNIVEDIAAIIRYEVITKKLNIYKDSSLWSEHILNKVPDGITVIDQDLNIIYSNEQRRKRHKNNILGKKCAEVFNKNDSKSCENCTFRYLIDHEQFALNSGERNSLKISDKASNVYWLLENTIIAHLKAYNYKIGILACKDINFRHEIFELAKEIQKLKQFTHIYQLIENTFITNLGFSNIRIYLNFSDTNMPINNSETCDSSASPRLVLIHSNNHKQRSKIGLRIPCEIFKEESYLTDSKTHELNYKNTSFDYLMRGRNGDYRIMSWDLLKPKTKLYNLFKEIDLPAKWIDIPLWDADKLIGMICLDYGNEILKWDLINNNIRKELLNGSHFLAISLNNIFNNNLYKQFHELSQEISIISKNDKIEKLVCKTIADGLKRIDKDLYQFVEVLYYKNIGKREYKLYATSHNSFKPKDIDNEVYHLETKNPNIILSDEIGKHIINKDTLSTKQDTQVLMTKFLSINSLCDVYLRANRNTFGIIRFIKKTDRSIPLSYYDYKLLRMLGTQISGILFGNENDKLRQLLNSIIQHTTSVDISYETSIFNYLKMTFSKFEHIYPNTAVTVFYKDSNKLRLEGYYGVVPINDPVKNLFYELPPDNLIVEEKLLWLQKYKVGFTPTLLYKDNEYITFNTRNDINSELKNYYDIPERYTKFDSFFKDLKEYQSECIRQIKYGEKVVGLIRFQDKNPFVYDENYEFNQFTEILSAQVGHTIKLLKYIEQLKDYEESLMHEFKGPVNKASESISKIERSTGLFIDDYFNNIEIHRKSNSHTISKSSFFPAFRSLRNENIFLEFVARSPYIESIDWEKEKDNGNFVELDIKKILIEVIYSLKHKIDLDTNHLSRQASYKKIELTYNIFSHKIYGVEPYLKMAFYNVIYNAIKYTHKGITFPELSREIKIYSSNEHVSNKDAYRIFITNFGLPVNSSESNLVFNKKYRSKVNAEGIIEGLGLGLFYSKLILNAHDADISMHPFPNENRTEVVIDF